MSAKQALSPCSSGPGGNRAQQFAQDQSQVEDTWMSQLTLENVLASARMAAPHPAWLVAACVSLFHQFPAPFQKLHAVIASHPSAALIDARLFLGLVLPAPLAPLPLLRNLAAQPIALHLLETGHSYSTCLSPVIRAVGVDLRIARMRLGPMYRLLGHRHFCRDQRPIQLLGIARAGVLQRNSHPCARVQVGGALGLLPHGRRLLRGAPGLMCMGRSATLHLRDARFTVGRALPALVRRALLALAVQLRQSFACRRLDA